MKLLPLITLAITLVFASIASADWTLTENSEIHYLSTKVFTNNSGSITENNVISGVTGSVSKRGKAKIDIDLLSLNTAVPIRNERVQKFVFGIDTFSPKATIEADVPAEALQATTQNLDIPAILTLAGQSTDVVLHVAVHHHHDTIQVVSVKPTVVKGSEFNMAAGFAKLTELAGLGYIPMDIPVSFSVTLVK